MNMENPTGYDLALPPIGLDTPASHYIKQSNSQHLSEIKDLTDTLNAVVEDNQALRQLLIVLVHSVGGEVVITKKDMIEADFQGTVTTVSDARDESLTVRLTK